MSTYGLVSIAGSEIKKAAAAAAALTGGRRRLPITDYFLSPPSWGRAWPLPAVSKPVWV